MEMIYSGKTLEGILVQSFFDVDSKMKKSLIAVEVELRCWKFYLSIDKIFLQAIWEFIIWVSSLDRINILNEILNSDWRHFSRLNHSSVLRTVSIQNPFRLFQISHKNFSLISFLHKNPERNWTRTTFSET